MPIICVEFHELVDHAVDLGYKYNDACTFMAAEVQSDEEAGYFSYDLDYLKSSDHTIAKKPLKVMIDFMEKHKLTDLKII